MIDAALNLPLNYTQEFSLPFAESNQTIVNGHIFWTFCVTLSNIEKQEKPTIFVRLRSSNVALRFRSIRRFDLRALSNILQNRRNLQFLALENFIA